MRAESITLFASLLWLSGCSAAPAPRDAGIDAGQDLGVDAGPSDLGLDTGPPRVRFAPRFLFNDPTVRCTPPPPLEMRATPGPRLPRGTVRWTYNPSADPAAREALGPYGSAGYQLDGTTLVGTTDGGFIATFSMRRFYLGVSQGGTFGFLRDAYRSRSGAAWLTPSTLMSRSGSDSPLSGMLYFEVIQTPRGHFVSARLPDPGPYPGVQFGDVETEAPTQLPDGTIIWTPTTSTLMAICPDGRPRWVLEYFDTGGYRRLFSDANGHIILAGSSHFGIYRIDTDGNVLATRETSSDLGAPLGFSDRCGLAMLGEPAVGSPMAVLSYYSGEDFSEVRSFPPSLYATTPTSDCGAWMSDPDTRLATRLRPDGSVGFTTPLGYGGGQELADGSWLTFEYGDRPPAFTPGMTITADDGIVTYQTNFDPITVGNRLRRGATLLTPDGVLYVTASSDVAGQQFAAIEVGIGPTPTWFGNGTNWSHDNATWHAVPPP